MDIREILKVLPHRYPFLLVDRVLEADERRFKALKNVTFNEPHFQGHFPGHPVMPGVLILEAMAQAAVGALVRHHRKLQNMSLAELSDKSGVHIARLSGIENGKDNPTIATMKHIADALKLPLNSFFEF